MGHCNANRITYMKFIKYSFLALFFFKYLNLSELREHCPGWQDIRAGKITAISLDLVLE